MGGKSPNRSYGYKYKDTASVDIIGHCELGNGYIMEYHATGCHTGQTDQKPHGQGARVSGTVGEISCLPTETAGQSSMQNRSTGIMENNQLCEIKKETKTQYKIIHKR